jgi:flagellar motor component MotA
MMLSVGLLASKLLLALSVVAGGTALSLRLSFGWPLCQQAWQAAMVAVQHAQAQHHKATTLLRQLVDLAFYARGHGLLALDGILPALSANSCFLERSLHATLNTVDVTQLQHKLTLAQHQHAQHQAALVEVLEQGSTTAPTMGLLSTLLGLGLLAAELAATQALHLTLPGFYWPLAALACLGCSTLGLGLAYGLCLPMAKRLQQQAQQQHLHHHAVIEACLSMAQQQHPLRLQERLEALLLYAYTPLQELSGLAEGVKEKADFQPNPSHSVKQQGALAPSHTFAASFGREA